MNLNSDFEKGYLLGKLEVLTDPLLNPLGRLLGVERFLGFKEQIESDVCSSEYNESVFNQGFDKGYTEAGRQMILHYSLASGALITLLNYKAIGFALLSLIIDK